MIKFCILLLFIALFFAPVLSRASEPYKRNIDIEWEPIEGAKSYDLELRGKGDEKNMSFQSETAIWSGPIKPGTYKMRIRSRDRRGVPGAWSGLEEFVVGLDPVQLKYPPTQANVETSQNEVANVEFKWSEVGGANSYYLELMSDDGKIKKAETVKENSLQLELPVCTGYTWKVKAEGSGLESASITTDHFNLLGKKLLNPKIQKPDNAFVRELKWSQPEYVQNYAFSLTRFNAKTKSWERIESNMEYKQNRIAFSPAWKGGRYKLTMKARGNLRPSSDKMEMDFMVREGDRSPAAEEVATLRQSIEHLSGWYGIASYLITIMDYKGLNWDKKTTAAFNGIGGTGRIGAGYLAKNNPWGFVGIVDLSGITLEGYGNYTFASTELNAIYRTPSGQRGEIRQQLGGFYKELPELIANSKTKTLQETHLLKYIGFHYGAEYWYAMSSKLGLQVNAHLYPNIAKVKTPTEQDLVPSVSGQFGLLGSYRIKKNMTGLLGYAFRHDEVKYQSSPTGDSGTGSVNSAIIEGHYMNLFLEWAL